MEIEVFRSGTVRDSGGELRNFSEADLDAIAATYNQRVASDRSEMAPIVKGHPKDNAPALGWTKYLKRSGDKLIAAIKDICPEFMEEYAAGRYRRVSISLYPDNMLRHIGFLGGMAPAVRGLQSADYSESDGVIRIPEDIEPVNIPLEVEFGLEFAALDGDGMNLEQMIHTHGELKECQKIINMMNQENRIRDFKEYCLHQTPKFGMKELEPMLMEYMPEFMEMAYQLDLQKSNFVPEHIDNHYTAKVKEFISNFSQLNLTQQLSGDSDFADKSHSNFNGKKVRHDRIEQHRRAVQLLHTNPNMSYEEAVNTVMTR